MLASIHGALVDWLDRCDYVVIQNDYAETEYLAVTDKIEEEQMKLNEKYKIKEAGMYLIIIKKI